MGSELRRGVDSTGLGRGGGGSDTGVRRTVSWGVWVGKAGVLPGKLLLRTEDWAWAVEQGSGEPERRHLKHFV